MLNNAYDDVVQSVIYEYCASCQKRLQWIVQVGAKRGLRKPNMDEVRQAKVIECFQLTSCNVADATAAASDMLS